MHHKRPLSGPFSAGARRSPCLQTPLCPPRLRGPGRPGLQPQSTAARGNPNTCARAGRRGGAGERDHPALPSWPPARPPLVPRTRRVERMGCRGPQTFAETKCKAGRDPSASPAARPAPAPSRRYQAGSRPRRAGPRPPVPGGFRASAPPEARVPGARSWLRGGPARLAQPPEAGGRGRRAVHSCERSGRAPAQAASLAAVAAARRPPGAAVRQGLSSPGAETQRRVRRPASPRLPETG